MVIQKIIAKYPPDNSENRQVWQELDEIRKWLYEKENKRG
jgi:hypothetical protein